jgi:hypothetical protein
MKQLTTLTLLLLLAFYAPAQTEQGDWLVGGELGFRTVESNSNFNFSPSAGWFILKNFAVGANLGIDLSKSGDTKTRNWGFGPFARFYFPGETLRPFLRVSLDGLRRRTETAGFTSTVKGNGYFLGLGLAIFINENVALEPVAGYISTNLKDREREGGFALRMGFQVYLNNQQMQVLKLNKN